MDSVSHLPWGLLRLLHRGLAPAVPDAPRVQALPARELSRSGLGFKDGDPETPLFRSAREAEEKGIRFMEAPAPGALPAPVYLCGRAASSFDVARALHEAGILPFWGSVLAASQTSGRGQLRRAWISPPGNIYAALRLPAGRIFGGLGAACVVGALLAEALHDLGCVVSMKWPNDLVVLRAGPGGSWAKVGGILLEERGDLLTAGIGLNLASAPSGTDLRTEHAFAAARLPETASGPLSPVGLWSALVERIFFCYRGLEKGGEREPLDLAEKHLAFRGRTVIVADGAGECGRGRLLGLDGNGGLRLGPDRPACAADAQRTDGSVAVFYSGSLQLPE